MIARPFDLLPTEATEALGRALDRVLAVADGIATPEPSPIEEALSLAADLGSTVTLALASGRIETGVLREHPTVGDAYVLKPHAPAVTLAIEPDDVVRVIFE